MKRYKPLFEEFPGTIQQMMFIKDMIRDYFEQVGSKKDQKDTFVKIVDLLGRHKLAFSKDEILRYLKKIS